MTDITKEILEKYQVRKNKKQKTDFINYISNKLNEMGYGIKTEKGLFGARNIVVGDIDNAKVIYTAHYDTCAVLPFPNFIAPKCFILYLLYQIAVVLGFFVCAFALGFAFGFIGALLKLSESIISCFAMIIYWLLLILIFAGPANKHTVNDNTSGVITLIEIMSKLNDTEKEKAAFVFFDLEEMGLFGSMSFTAKHKAIKKQGLVVNFDCVSDGNNMLFILKKGAKSKSDVFKNAFKSSNGINSEIVTKGIFYPSDQASFKCGVGVGCFKKTKKLSVLYLNRIHTKRDTVFNKENITFLTEGSLKLISML